MRNVKIKPKTAIQLTSALLCCALMTPLTSYAYEDDEYTPDLSNTYDFKTISGALQRLTPHGNELMGDMIDKNTGSITFSNTDISLPGNSELEVAIHRKLSQGARHDKHQQQAFDDWVLDLPTISNTHAGEPPVINGGCIVDYGGLRGSGTTLRHVYVPSFDMPNEDHNDGAVLNIPGKNLSGFLANAQAPSDPKNNWNYKDQENDFSGNCATVVVAPNGTKYKFGRHDFREGKDMYMPIQYRVPIRFSFLTGVAEVTLFRNTIVWLITEIEDVHGNYVRYEYTDDKAELTRIYSNDNREINLHYLDETPIDARNSRRISHITANDRTWHYDYETDGGLSLQKVTLPDGRYWQLGAPTTGMDAMRYEKHYYYYCLPYDKTMTIKHPDGAVGTFRLLETRHLKSAKDNGDAFNGEGEHYIKPQLIDVAEDDRYCWIGKGGSPRKELFERPQGWPIYQSMSVVEKTISGDNIPNATWEFDYRNYDGTAATGGLDVDNTWTTITEPDGTKRKYTYHTRGNEHGLLKSLEVTDSSSLIESFLYEYDLSQTNQSSPYYQHCEARNSDGNETAGTCFTYLHRPQTNVIHKRYNSNSKDTYTKEIEYDKAPVTNKFIDYGRPNKITNYSSLQTQQRIIDIEYEHNESANIFGLIKNVVRNGKEFVRYEYNAKGQKHKIYTFGNRGTNEALVYSYHSDGTINTITDANNDTAKLENYYRGQARKITRRDGSILTRTIDANGWVTSETNPNLYTTEYEYTDAGWMKAINRPAPWLDTDITYHNLGKTDFHRIISQGANQTTEWYDSMFRPYLTKQEDIITGWYNYTNSKFDNLGRVEFESYPSLSSTETKGTSYEYDALNRKTKVTQYPSIITSYDYLVGNSMAMTDPDNYVTTTTKSGYGSPTDGDVISIASPENVTTAMTYDVWGNIKTLQQSGNQDGFYVNQTHKYFYDTHMRLCRQEIPELGAKLLAYDAANQLTSYAEGQARLSLPSTTLGANCTTPTSDKVTLTYDASGRLKNTLFSDATPDIFRLYDNNGNLERITRGNVVWDYDYYNNDSLERELLTIDGLSFNTHYERDGYNNVSAITYPSGDLLALNPDSYGRPRNLTTTNTGFSNTYAKNVEYYPNSSLKRFEYGNGVAFTQGLNDRQLPETRHVENSAGTDIFDLIYEYDNRANTESITDNSDNLRNVFNTYDGLSRLKTSNSLFGNITFTYDAIGNLRQRQVSGGNSLGGSQHNSTINYNSLNRVSSVVTSTGTRSFGYDDKGNVEGNGLHTFSYDQANQPTTIAGNQTGSFVYDGNLKRAKKSNASGDVYFAYTNESGLVSQYNKTTNVHTDYIRLNGQTIARVESSGSMADSSTTAFNGTAPSTSATGLNSKDYYLPFGKSVNGDADKDNAIGFTGHVKDSSGLTYMQARYYDPVIGRFLSNDPVGAIKHLSTSNGFHGFNRYTYANNNPYKYIDPDGKKSSFARNEDRDVEAFGKGEINRKEFAKRAGERTEAAGVASTSIPSTGAAIKVVKVVKAASKAGKVKELVETISTAVEAAIQVVAVVVGMSGAPSGDLDTKPSSISSGRGAKARNELKENTKVQPTKLSFGRKK